MKPERAHGGKSLIDCDTIAVGKAPMAMDRRLAKRMIEDFDDYLRLYDRVKKKQLIT